MAGLALGAKSSTMGVLQPVTCCTGRTEVLVDFAGVTGRAGHRLVRRLERKPGLGVVERLDAAPSLLVVASAAFFAQPPLVGFDRLVTIEAAPGRFSERDRLHMAAVAACGLVSALELEVCERVVECFPVELDDVGASPLVVGVTMPAIAFRRVGMTPMESPGLRAVGRDDLVTRQAKTRLRLPRERLVALPAFLFELGVSLDQGPRHHQ